MVANTTIDNINREIDKCNNLKIRHFHLKNKARSYVFANRKLLRENDSIKLIEFNTRQKYEDINSNLTKTKNKRISIIGGIGIGLGAFGLGALLF